MFRVMIVEDEVHILNYMKKKLSEYEIFKVEATFSSPEEALSSFEAIQPDVVFLDIEMPRINGIDLARRLLDKKYDLQIVFTTAYGQYALEAFEVEAIDYLMKPIVSDDILRVIKRLEKVIDIKSSHKSMEDKVGEYKEGDNNKKVAESICCFGSFQLIDRNGQLIKWPTRKAEELFAYFLINQRKYISKWELLELFWDDMDEERGN
jgi:two-component system LytT family response regulator